MSAFGVPHKSLAKVFFTNRFICLLAFFCALFVLLPFLDDSMLYGHIADVLYLAGLMAALSSIKNSRIFYLALALASAVAVMSVMEMLSGNTGLLLPTLVLAQVVLGISIVEISALLMRKRNVDMDTVMGGICVYLLMGFFWTEAYVSLELVHPGSFDFTVHQAAGLMSQYMLLNYYSFMTLLTVGYGDIVPLSPLAQTWAVLEGLMGQIYIVVFMARLVSMAVACRQDSGEE